MFCPPHGIDALTCFCFSQTLNPGVEISRGMAQPEMLLAEMQAMIIAMLVEEGVRIQIAILPVVVIEEATPMMIDKVPNRHPEACQAVGNAEVR